MKDTKTLIAQLSSEEHLATIVRTPVYWSAWLLAVLVIYGIAMQLLLGLRADLDLQFTRFLFSTEIILLAALLLTSSIASVLAMYPDAYQKLKLLMLPYAVLIMVLGLVIFQLFIPPDVSMIMPLPKAHSIECAVFIGAAALIPSAIIFVLLRKGASLHQLQAGSFAVLTASSIGCLTLRLAEANDSIIHLVVWHYLPILFFAAFGAILGRWLLKW